MGRPQSDRARLLALTVVAATCALGGCGESPPATSAHPAAGADGGAATTADAATSADGATSPDASAQPDPRARAVGGVFVEAFEWTWPDLAQECALYLGPKGFAAVLVSPPSEHAILPQYPWYE